MDIDLLEESVNKIFGEMQDDLIRRMSKRISKMGFASVTTLYEAERAVAAGAVYEDVVRAIAKTCEKSEAEIKRYSPSSVPFSCSIRSEPVISPVTVM